MNWGAIIAVIIYELATIIIVSSIIARRNKKRGGEEAGGFAFAGAGLPASLVGVTLALTLLGSAHNWGTSQNAGAMGVIAVWFSIACVVMMVVITQFTGPWIRRSGAKTVGEFLAHIFGKKSGALVASINAALGISMCALEVETIAVTLAFLTGWSYMVCAVIGGIIACLYVLLAGMKEIAWLNLINAVVMYVSLIVVLICLCFSLPGGWDGVEASILASETPWYTSMFGNGQLIIGYAIPTAVGASLFHGMAQTGYQPVATAKSNKEVKKSLWFAGPVNGMFCIIPALIGVAAFSIIVYRNAGTLNMTPAMLKDLLPPWAVALLAAGFLGVDLSSFAVMALAPATVITHDMYGIKNPRATEKQQTRLIRIIIVIITVISIVICNLQPAPVEMVNWIFSFGIPVFVMAVIGMWWKRSEMATIITFIITWIAVCIWSTFGLQNTLAASNPAFAQLHVNYVSLIFAIILGLILTAVLPGKPGLYKGKGKKKAEAEVNA